MVRLRMQTITVECDDGDGASESICQHSSTQAEATWPHPTKITEGGDARNSLPTTKSSCVGCYRGDGDRVIIVTYSVHFEFVLLTHAEELIAVPRPPRWISGALLLMEWRGGRGRKSRGGMGREERGERGSTSNEGSMGKGGREGRGPPKVG